MQELSRLQQTIARRMAQSRSTVARYRRGEPLADNADLLARAGHLLGIHKALRILFPQDRDLAYRWVTTPNRRFGERARLHLLPAQPPGTVRGGHRLLR